MSNLPKILSVLSISVIFAESPLPSYSTAAAAAAKSLQSCPTLCDPRDGNPPGSPSNTSSEDGPGGALGSDMLGPHNLPGMKRPCLYT